MKFKYCTVKNFGSYKDFTLNFDSLGLTAITGETGAGKSTILDMIPWILFGETSKDTKADDIRSWNATDPTSGELHVEKDGKFIAVVRARGNSSENDLYFSYDETLKDVVRGKSILETQQMLTEVLGVNADLYFTSAYLHQFSKADTFFISRPNERREVFEKIVDQSLAIKLADKVVLAKKPLKQQVELNELELASIHGKLGLTKSFLSKALLSNNDYETKQRAKESSLMSQSEAFDLNKTQALYLIQAETHDLVIKLTDPDARSVVDSLKSRVAELGFQHKNLSSQLYKLKSLIESTCPVCMGPTHNDNRQSRLKELKTEMSNVSRELAVEHLQLAAVLRQTDLMDKLDSLDVQMKQVEASKNPYTAQIQTIRDEVNPYLSQITEYESQIVHFEELAEQLSAELSTQKNKLSLLSLLYDLSFDLRGAILSQAIIDIETSTNHVLSQYFDAELMVKFSLENSDKLELEIQKSGNTCSFKQLSGGQRCMLKLAFNLSLMKLAENKAGMKFSTLMLDEPLTGLSDDLKLKAFSLFESLTKDYETILVIEHSEALKSCFNSAIHVILEGDESKISYS